MNNATFYSERLASLITYLWHGKAMQSVQVWKMEHGRWERIA